MQANAWVERVSRLKTVHRIDAEHFQPAFDELEERLTARSSTKRLGEIASYVRRGVQPRYVPGGPVLVINSQHVGKYLLNVDGAERTDDEFWEATPRARAKQYDVLMNSTGLGSIGRVNCVLHDAKTVVDNHVSIIRAKKGECDPLYLSVYLNSRFGRMQTEKWLSGSSGQLEIYPDDIKRFIVLLPDQDFQATIRKAVLEAHKKYTTAMSAVHDTQRAVESLIDK
jgi:restriction endonuclease S subunit